MSVFMKQLNLKPGLPGKEYKLTYPDFAPKIFWLSWLSGYAPAVFRLKKLELRWR